MKLNDAVWGALLMLLGSAILVHVQRFPTIPGQRYGPAIFPGLIAAGLAVCGALLIVRGIAVRDTDGGRAPWITLGAWTRSPRHVLAFAATVGVNVFYILCAEKLGFIPAAFVYLAVLFAVFGVRPLWIAPIALASTLLIHTAFYKLLKVPLPWGLLQGYVW